jgi:hypothetical protein
MERFIRFVLAFTVVEFLLVFISLLLVLWFVPMAQGKHRPYKRHNHRPQGHGRGENGVAAKDQPESDNSSSEENEDKK